MFKTRQISVFFLLFILSACSFLGAQQVRHNRTTSLVSFLYPDGQIPDDTQNPVLHLPLRVGLAYIPETRGQQVLDLDMKQTLLEGIKTQFENLDYMSHIEAIPSIYLSGQSQLDQVKVLYNLDVMALVSYDQIVNRKENILALTYLTIVGNYIFPGSHYSASTLIDMAVIDLKTRHLLFRAAGASQSKGQRPEAYTRHAYDKHQNQDFQTAMQAMNVELKSALMVFEERLRNPDPHEHIQVKAREGYSMSSDGWMLLLLIMAMLITRAQRQ